MAKTKRPGLMFMAAMMLLSMGILLKLVSAASSKPSELTKQLTAVSQGGNAGATTAYEQAVNRFVLPEPPLTVPFEEVPDKFLQDNALALPYLDAATGFDRINFRREWSEGFKVSGIGVIDIRNLALLNYARLTAAATPDEAKRLTAAIRTLAGYLEFDPMIRAAAIYAPSMHIYLFAVEKAVNENVYSTAELQQLLAQLTADEAKYREIFINAVKTETQMLYAYPSTLERVMNDLPSSERWQAEGEFAAERLERLAGLLKEDYYLNRSLLDSCTAFEKERVLAARLVPNVEFAQLLARLQTHNRVAQAAIMAELGMRSGAGRPEKIALKDALTGEELQYGAMSRPGIRVQSGNTPSAEAEFTIFHLVN